MSVEIDDQPSRPETLISKGVIRVMGGAERQSVVIKRPPDTGEVTLSLLDTLSSPRPATRITEKLPDPLVFMPRSFYELISLTRAALTQEYVANIF